MGCSNSSIRVQPTNKPKRTIFDSMNDPPPASSSNDHDRALRDSVHTIIQGISKIPKAERLSALVCMNEKSVPIALAPLCLERGDATKVSLPVVGISMASHGRLLVLGHIHILSKCDHSDTDFSAFLENCVRWVGGFGRNSYKVILLDMPESAATEITKNFKNFDFVTTPLKEIDENTKCHVIICMSSNKQSADIEAFLKRGGGVIVATSQEDEHNPKMAEFLLNNGIGLPDCSLQVGSSTSSVIKTNKSFSELSQQTYPKLVEQYKKLISNENLDLEAYDTLVTTLRYYVLVLNNEPNDYTNNLIGYTWDFLNSSDYKTDEGFCPLLQHGITVVLMSEIYPKLPARYFDGQDYSEVFPGKPGDCQLADFSINTVFACEEINSTGLYLPPGIIATISVEKVYPGIFVQIGSHSENLLLKPGPWKRWASLILTYDIDKETVEIASPFGGIVYLGLREFVFEEELEFQATFRNISRYPLFHLDEADAWESTKDLDVPWSEIETRFLILTVPTKEAKKVTDVVKFTSLIDALISELLTFTRDESQRLYRVVFDIELPEGTPVSSYPISMDLIQLPGILFTEGPTTDLFTMLTLLASQSIDGLNLGEDAEKTVTLTAGLVAFKKVWPSVDPLQYVLVNPPPIFKSFWDIYLSHDEDLIPSTIGFIRETVSFADGSSSNLWILFVNKLNDISKENFKQQLITDAQQVRVPGRGVLVTFSSHSLNDYQLDQADALDQVTK